MLGPPLLGLILPHLLQLSAPQGVGMLALVGLGQVPCKQLALSIHKIAIYTMVADVG